MCCSHPQVLDLLRHFELQRGEVYAVSVQSDRLLGRCLELVDQLVNEGAALGMVARGMASEKSAEHVSASGHHLAWIEELAEDSQSKFGHRVGQRRLQGRAGPADEIKDTAPCRAHQPLIAVMLLGQSLQRVLLGAGHVYSAKPAPAEAGHCAERMSID